MGLTSFSINIGENFENLVKYDSLAHIYKHLSRFYKQPRKKNKYGKFNPATAFTDAPSRVTHDNYSVETEHIAPTYK